jgi:hypothetical protein
MRSTLTIAIPTVEGREKQFNQLYDYITKQIEDNNLENEVKIIYLKDNKEMSIGAKRQKLYEMSESFYTVQPDDDDWLNANYVKKVYEACLTGVDCVGYIEHCTDNAKHIGNSILTKNYTDWIEKITPCAENHFCVRVRTPYMKTPIKTDICLKVGVADMRLGEDHDFARKILPHLKTEVFIPELMYFYRHMPEAGGHNKRYGIK